MGWRSTPSLSPMELSHGVKWFSWYPADACVTRQSARASHGRLMLRVSNRVTARGPCPMYDEWLVTW